MDAKTYFMQSDGGGPIKIGSSANPTERLRSIQTGHHSEIKLIAHIDQDIEKRLHREFKDLRLRGEWFRPEKRLVDWILENALIAKGMRPTLKRQAAIPVSMLADKATPREEELCDKVFDWGPDIDLELMDIAEDPRNGFGYCGEDTDEDGQDGSESEDSDLEGKTLYCGCDLHTWGRCVYQLLDCSIIERVGVNVDERIVVLSLKPLNTDSRRRQLHVNLADIAFQLDCIGWTLKAIALDPFTETKPSEINVIELYIANLETLPGVTLAEAKANIAARGWME